MQLNTIATAIEIHDPLAKGVINAASSLAKSFGAKLHIFAVFQDTTYSSAANPPLANGLGLGTAPVIDQVDNEGMNFESAESRLQEIVKEAGVAELVSSTKLIRGVPSIDIPKYAEELDADLIVIGGHDKGFWERLISGSTSDIIKHKTTRALFVVTERFCKENLK